MLTTPQKKSWSRWSLTPRSENHKSPSSANPRIGDVSGLKGAAVLEATPTPASGAVYGNGGSIAEDGGDPVTSVEKVSQLENELFEYQYNMGLLVIEKKEWTSKYEDLQLALAEATDALKREQAAHLIAISDIEKREEKLRKALGVEKQCVNDLEKALREMRAEYAEIKFTADSKLAEANSLAISIEEKSLEVEAKLREAEARFAEASRRSSDIERKMQELDGRESALKRARMSFDSERETHDSTLSKQREDLREWEKKLQEGEERLYEAQRILNQREERVNEVDRRYKQKENDLEEAQKKIDLGNKELKKTEEEINNKTRNLKEKEQEVDILRKRIEKKETELHAWEEKLSERENTELQKLLDQHKSELDARKQEFELELQQKRISADEELRNRVLALEKGEAEIKHMEEKIAKREEALEKKMEKLKQKENDLDTKSKALKAGEKSMKAEEKRLDAERKQVLLEKENLLCLKAELEQKEADLSEQLRKILEEKEQLRVTEEERLDHVHLQSELKLEIEKCRHQKEELIRQADALKQERETFEKEWEGLDEKKTEIEKELKNINEEMDRLEKWRQVEQEKLTNETFAAENNIQREMEALKLAKEAFAAEMDHEKSLLSQKAHSERSQMLNEIELRKRELEIEMQKKMEEMERSLREKERSFEEEREKELNKITHMREEAEKGMEDMKVETCRIEKQREEVEANRKDLEEQRIEIQKDIEQLVILSGKLKDQREQFLKERERFIAFVEKHEGCQKCGEITREFVVSDLQSLHETKSGEILPLPKLAEHYMRSGESPGLDDSGTPRSAGKVSSWLRKCTSKIFLFSPNKRNEKIPMQNLEDEASPEDQENTEPELDKIGGSNDLPGPTLGVVNDSFEIQRVRSADDNIREEEVEGGQDTSVREESNINDEKQEVETSQLSGLNGQSKPGKKRGRARVTRNRTIKAVVKDAEAILGNDVEHNDHKHPNGDAEDPSHMKEASQEDLSLVEKENGRKGRKRSHTQTSRATACLQDGNDSEGNTESIATGRSRKRRQKAPQAVEAPAEKRYNLRRPRNVVQGTTGRASSKTVHPSKTGQVLGENINLEQAEAAGETSGGRIQVATGLNENVAMSEEVNGSPDRHEYSNVTPGHDAENSVREGGNEDDDEEEEDEETLQPGEASIGKKLWTFFTT